MNRNGPNRNQPKGQRVRLESLFRNGRAAGPFQDGRLQGFQRTCLPLAATAPQPGKRFGVPNRLGSCPCAKQACHGLHISFKTWQALHILVSVYCQASSLLRLLLVLVPCSLPVAPAWGMLQVMLILLPKLQHCNRIRIP